MGNMSYCQFRNTLEDLQDCYANWDTENEEEIKARKRLLKLCKEIADNYSDPD